MAVNGSISARIDLTDIRQTGVSVAQESIGRTPSWTVTPGTGAGQMNLCYQAVITVAGGANQDIDVSAALTNQLGPAVFTRVKNILFHTDPANTTVMTIGRGASNGLPFLSVASATIQLEADEWFSLVKQKTGVVVTPATGDLINVANAAGASATVTVILGGLS